MTDFLQLWGALIVAAIALAQPWLLGIYKRFLRRGRVEIFETGSIDVGFSSFGPTIGLAGTLSARDRDMFVRSARVEIVRQKDQSKHSLAWTAFRSPRIVIGRGEEVQVELPASFMLLRSQPKVYNILFSDTDTQEEMRRIVEHLQSAWNQYLVAKDLIRFLVNRADVPNPVSESTSFGNAYDEFCEQEKHVNAYAHLDRICYWQEGEYSLTFAVDTVHPIRTFSRTWRFSLTEADVKLVRLNSLKILQDTCGQYSRGPYFFGYAKYQE